MPTYLNNQINSSPTRVGKSGAAIEDVRFRAVKFDTNGDLVLASSAGEAVLGIAIATTGDATGKVAKGDKIDVQIKDIGLAMAGAAITAGSPVTTDANAKLVTATAGNFVLGYAMTASAQAGDIIEVQIAKGYYPTAG